MCVRVHPSYQHVKTDARRGNVPYRLLWIVGRVCAIQARIASPVRMRQSFQPNSDGKIRCSRMVARGETVAQRMTEDHRAAGLSPGGLPEHVEEG